MRTAYVDGCTQLLHGDCREIPAPSEPYVLVTDPPFTIRTPEHVDEMLASYGWKPIKYVVLTNPEHGFVFLGGEAPDREWLAPIGGPPTFERPLWAMLRLIPLSNALVFDPFAGTGTTLLAARLSGSRSLGIERNEATVRIACRRLALSAQS